MPELQHYATWDEAIAMLRDVAGTHRLKLIPEPPRLPEPRVDVFDGFVPAVAERLAGFRVLLLEGDFTEHPLQFARRKEGSAAGTYYVDFLSGGPRLRWILPVINPEPRPTLVSGTIGFLKSYRNPVTDEWGPPSEKLKAAFKAVTTTMRRHMVSVAVAQDRKLWIGREAKRQLDEGKLFLDL